MLFEKLVEQHGVHRLVANGGEFAFGVMGHQVGIHLRHLLGDKAELRDASLIQFGLVMESHWAQGKQRLTGITHVGNVGLKAACGEKHAQLAGIVHVTGTSTRPDGVARNTGDVRRGLVGVADANGTVIALKSLVTDVNVAAAGGNEIACPVADADIAVARRVEERIRTERGVVAPSRVGRERCEPDGGLVGAGGVERRRLVTDGGVIVSNVIDERLGAEGGVDAPRVVVKRDIAEGGIVGTRLIGVERLVSTACVAVARCVAVKSLVTARRVVCARGVAIKR